MFTAYAQRPRFSVEEQGMPNRHAALSDKEYQRLAGDLIFRGGPHRTRLLEWCPVNEALDLAAICTIAQGLRELSKVDTENKGFDALFMTAIWKKKTKIELLASKLNPSVAPERSPPILYLRGIWRRMLKSIHCRRCRAAQAKPQPSDTAPCSGPPRQPIMLQVRGNPDGLAQAFDEFVENNDSDIDVSNHADLYQYINELVQYWQCSTCNIRSRFITYNMLEELKSRVEAQVDAARKSQSLRTIVERSTDQEFLIGVFSYLYRDNRDLLAKATGKSKETLSQRAHRLREHLCIPASQEPQPILLLSQKV